MTKTTRRAFLAALALLPLTLTAGQARADGPLLATGRFDAVKHADVVVVKGSADHMEQVLARAKVNFVTVAAEDLPEMPLHSRQVLMVNCRGTMSEAAAQRVRRF